MYMYVESNKITNTLVSGLNEAEEGTRRMHLLEFINSKAHRVGKLAASWDLNTNTQRRVEPAACITAFIWSWKISCKSLKCITILVIRLCHFLELIDISL